MSKSQYLGLIVNALTSNTKGALKALYYFAKEDFYKRKAIKQHRRPQGFPTIDLLDLFPDLNININSYSFLDHTSSVIDIALLKSLAKQFNNCDYLEIGTLRGESIVNIAEVTNSCTSISLSDEEMKQMNINERYIQQQRLFSKNIPAINHIHSNSRTFDFKSLNKKFDLIFIDGDHEYEGILADTKTVFNLLKDENSVIVWHDYGFSPERTRWTTVAAILDGMPASEHNHLYHVSNSLCAIYTRKQFKTKFINSPEIPNKAFTIDLKANKTV